MISSGRHGLPTVSILRTSNPNLWHAHAPKNLPWPADSLRVWFSRCLLHCGNAVRYYHSCKNHTGWNRIIHRLHLEHAQWLMRTGSDGRMTRPRRYIHMYGCLHLCRHLCESSCIRQMASRRLLLAAGGPPLSARFYPKYNAYECASLQRQWKHETLQYTIIIDALRSRETLDYGHV